MARRWFVVIAILVSLVLAAAGPAAGGRKEVSVSLGLAASGGGCNIQAEMQYAGLNDGTYYRYFEVYVDGRKNLVYERLGGSAATGATGVLVATLSMWPTVGESHVVKVKGIIETSGTGHDRVVVKKWSSEYALDCTYPPPA